ncbi:MAG: zinc-ribbon domain-containing protein [Lachnospiraceae bacterium]|nr:zinc-ribbon domain-containing protein [Lachnospiraceae bacterium]
MFCMKCGTQNADGAAFCIGCGERLTPATPVPAPVVETPVVEEPVVETPVVETPVVETPVVEAPVVEAPVVETPVVEAPVAETPVVEEPVVETPVVEEPVVEAPVVETPVVEEPVAETPVVEEPVVEAPVVDAAPAEPVTYEQPVYEQPVQQPVYEQPVQQPVYEQPVQQPVYQQPVYEQPVQQPVYQQQMYQQPAPQEAPKKKKKHLGLKIFLIILGLLIVGAGTLVALHFFVWNKTVEVDLSKYVEVEFEGYEGFGTAKASFDKKAFEKDFGEEIKINKFTFLVDMIKGDEKIEWSKVPDQLDEIDAIDGLVEKCIDGSLDKTDGLSNGDKIKYTFECDDETAKDYFNTVMQHEEIEFEVENLDAAAPFDPFENLEVRTEGIDGEGTAELYFDLVVPELDDLTYTLDKEMNLTNGDYVTVNVSLNISEDEFRNKYGKVLESTQKEYQVIGLSQYISSNNDMSSFQLNQLQSAAEPKLNELFTFTADGGMEFELENANYIGNVIVKKNPGSSIRSENVIFMVYEIDEEVTIDNDEVYGSEDLKLYEFVAYKDILAVADELSFDTLNVVYTENKYEFEILAEAVKKGKPNQKWNCWILGYDNIDDLAAYLSDTVSQLDDVTVEDNITLSHTRVR